MTNSTSFIGKIESVPESDKVTFITENTTRTYQKTRILLAFNDFGRYLVIKNLPESPLAAMDVIKKFYDNQSKLPTDDIIFRLKPFEVIPCTIVNNQDAVNYRTKDGKAASINKENVLAIINKDGTHEIVRDVEEVVPFLVDGYAKFDLYVSGKSELPIPKPEPKPVPPPKPEPITINENPTPPPVVINTNLKPRLSVDEKEKYSKQSIDNIITFKDYLNKIGDNTKSPTERRDAIKSALELFTPGATIEVTSKNRPGSRKLPVEIYLKNLSSLSYRSVDIEYANLRFVSELSQADDGNYYGLVRGEQTFIGFGANGKPLYSDVVEKNYKVKVQPNTTEVNTIKEVKWKVLLGDVSVSQ